MQQTKSAHIIERRRQAGTLKQQVQKLLQWSDEQYTQFQYQMGLSYLFHLLGNSACTAELEGSKIFWNWFKNKWSERDQQFIDWFTPDISGKVRLSTLVRNYLHRHDPQMLAAGRAPNGLVMEAGYAKMYQDIIDNEIHVTK